MEMEKVDMGTEGGVRGKDVLKFFFSGGMTL